MRNKLQKIGLVSTGIFIGVAVSLNFSAIADREATQPLPLDELRAFTEVYGKIKSDYVEPVEDKKLISQAINGMLSGLDPHSAYMDADEFKDLQVGTQGEFGGLGIEVGMEDGFVKVVSPIEDTPAQKAGLKSGDLIIKLDDVPVKGMSINDAVKRMRGKPNTPITLTVVRKGMNKPFNVTLIRAIIKVKSVKFKLVEPNFGYVRITQFQEHTGENLVDAINALLKENKAPLKGLVLDLRNDPGGLLNSAVGVSAAFLKPNSLVVYTDGRAEDSKMHLTASPDFYLRGNQDDYLKALPDWVKSVPMVVLVNSGSASASEIVAGALQDQKRAVIMGTQSFGKGSVQTILPLGNGTGIKLTTARYFTPSGRSIQAKGITPDIVVEEGTVVGNSEEDGFGVREVDLENHLTNPNSTVTTTTTIVTPPTVITPENTGDKMNKTNKGRRLLPGEIVSKDDFQLNQALSLLKGINILKTVDAPAKPVETSLAK
ncbi:S41 family peptidase [Sulfuriferula nivalis]|uniref:Peptidase S41 n=1 Tax=Sulfuriferula nivalis TaxID=2675298 RepID=A0A809SIE4_9PROT|nr:S41 family peptidase [Sulfuriferula nivalis]BBP01740.1 peptidase S41 [Sulfuriferula nivalis]